MQRKFKLFLGLGPLQSQWEGGSVMGGFGSPVFPSYLRILVHVLLGQALRPSPHYCKEPHDYVPHIACLLLQLLTQQPEPSDSH